MHISLEICINIRRVIKWFCDLVILFRGVCNKNANYYLCMHLSSYIKIWEFCKPAWVARHGRQPSIQELRPANYKYDKVNGSIT